MLVQNRALKGQVLALRYTRDRDGRPVQVKGDAEGVFDLPKAEATLLCQTPGWAPVAKGKAPVAPVVPETPQGPPVVAEAPESPSEAPESPPEELEDPPEAEESQEGPDIDGIRTKAQVVRIAEEWRARGYDIPELDTKAPLVELKATLTSALYGDAE